MTKRIKSIQSKYVWKQMMTRFASCFGKMTKLSQGKNSLLSLLQILLS